MISGLRFIPIIVLSILIALPQATQKASAWSREDGNHLSFVQNGAVYVYTYSAIWGADNGLRLVAAHGGSPVWSNNGQYLAYIDTSTPNAYQLAIYDVASEHLIESRRLGSILANHIVWSASDNFLAISTQTGELYTYDIWGLDTTNPNRIALVPNVQLGASHRILYIDWDLHTNRIFYSSPGLGIAALSPDGTNYSLLYDAATKGTANRDITAFSLERKNLGEIYYIAAGLIYDYRYVADIEHPYQELNVLPGARTSIEINNSSSMWADYYPLYFAITNAGNIEIKGIDSIGSNPTIRVVFTPPGTSPVTDISVLPLRDEATLYASSVEGGGYSSNPNTTYTVSFYTNSLELKNTPIEITPVLRATDGTVHTDSAITISPSAIGIYGNGSHTFSITAPKEGAFKLGCTFNIDNSLYLEQSCPFDKTFQYIRSRLMVYRFANWRTHERLFTTNEDEAATIDGVDGWVYEDVAFNVYDATDGIAVYRMANWKTHERLFTTDWNEVQAIKDKNGWVYESTAFYAETSGIAVYRLANYITHERLFTTNKNEVETIKNKNGWVYENIAFYAPEFP